ncbi:tetratricopeptide repeat protein [Magnetospirillum sp. SS-4]|uniref:tetratricopeptide repeat protein n=1 Tax=Magnetospirillum sp. SS-4 TaxID=2681465 RepID=UPI0013841778|nr:tetratricopeptide repeat protein [Magnetospirillum sp. SS-4]CAA7626360.1 hypothetical protein MTBSS4_60189 [Magnetospirillum sp. SS-4]
MAQGRSLQSIFQQAVNQHRAGDFAGAEKTCSWLISLDRKCAPAYQMLGAIALGRGDAAGAAKRFATVAELMPRSFEAFINLGLAQKALGRPNDAIRSFETAVRLAPTLADTHNHLGICLLEAGRPAEAVPRFEAAVRAVPHAAELHVNLGNALLMAGAPREAEAAFLQALGRDANNLNARINLSGALVDQGRLEEAAANLQAVLATAPRNVRALTNLGAILKTLGRLDAAAGCHAAALEVQPDYPEALCNLAAVRTHQGRPAEAAELARRALGLRPGHAESLVLLGDILLSEGKAEDARRHYTQALGLNPGSADTMFRLATAHQAAGNDEAAETLFRQAMDAAPNSVTLLVELCRIRAGQGRTDEAAGLAERALALHPDHPLALSALGNVRVAQSRLDEAETLQGRAIERSPNLSEAILGLSRVWYWQGRLDEAADLLRQALDRVPDQPDILVALANTVFDRDAAAAEECFRHALRLRPDDYVASHRLAALLQSQNRTDEAAECYAAFLDINPGHVAATLAQAQLFPVIAPSVEDSAARRATLSAVLDRITTRPAAGFDPLNHNGRTNFQLAYHALDDRDLQAATARALLHLAPSLGWRAPSRPKSGGRIRLGIISRYLCEHTIGKLLVRMIETLDRQRFDVVILHTRHHADSMARRIDACAQAVTVLPENLESARGMVAAQELDILFYPDIGMDPFTYFLAYSRLAPVQVMSWGHPDTTGIPNMDHFLSSEAFEPDGAERHYTERLIKMRHLTFCYERPPHPDTRPVRADYGLAEDDHLYVCAQTLFKFHPDFDHILADILRRDPKGRIILISGRHPTWNDALLQRFATVFPDHVDQVIFLPPMSRQAYMGLLMLADANLDPIHFGGGNSSYEAFAMASPIVTWPGEFLRSRLTLGQYIAMGMTDLVADSAGSYADLCLRLGNDPAFRAAMSARIAERSNLIFEDHGAVREIEDIFENLVRN